MRQIAIVTTVLALGPSSPTLSANQGCDITTSSYVRVLPPERRQVRSGRPSRPIVTMPQTPCATIPNGWENAIGPIGVEISPRANEDANQPGEEPEAQPRRTR
jgi:hypothetical protein